MLFVRSIINLLFVPLVSVFLLYRKRNKDISADISFLFTWGFMVVMNIPLTRVFTFIIRKTSGISIEADSSYYTVIALIAAVLLFKVYDYGKNICEAVKNSYRKQG